MVATAVEYVGGPYNGVLEPEMIRARMAIILFKQYSQTPPRDGVGWWMRHAEYLPDPAEEDGLRVVTHYYRIREQLDDEGKIVCKYGGTEHPTDHTHDWLEHPQ